MLPIHERILALLLEIDGICREKGIRYWLHGGTLLGAVRRGAFLPWDDDGDILMTRGEWERFRAAFREKPIPGRALECREDCPGNLRLFPRYLDTGTTMAFISGMANTGFDCLTVDILLVEELPRDPAKQEKYKAWLRVWGELACRRYILSRRTPWGLYRLARAGARLLGEERVEELIRRRLAALCRGEETDYIQLPILYGELWVCPRAFLGEPETVCLEGHPFPAPSPARAFLRHVYGGGWMLEPPAGARLPHTGNISFLPYSLAEEECRPWVDRQRLERAFLRDKARRVRQAPWQARGEVLAARYLALAVSMAMGRDLMGRDPAALLREGRFPELEELFGDYLRQQLGRPLASLGIPAPIPGEALEVLGFHLALTGRSEEAAALLELHGEAGRAAGARGLGELIEAGREASRALWDRRDPGEAAALARPWLERYPLHETFAALDLWEKLEAPWRAARRHGPSPLPALLGHGRKRLPLARGKAGPPRPQAAGPRRRVFLSPGLRAAALLGRGERLLALHPASPGLGLAAGRALLLLGRGEEAAALLRFPLAGRNSFLARAAERLLAGAGLPLPPPLPEEEPEDGKVRRVQEILLALLTEVDGICRRAGIPYFLGGMLAAQAAGPGRFLPGCCSNYLLLHPAHREAFLRAAREALPPGRMVESFETFPGCGDLAVRYGDTGSLMMELPTHGSRRCQGVSLQLRFLRPLPRSRREGRFADFLDAALEGAALPRVWDSPTWRRRAASLWGRGMMLLLGRRGFKTLCWRFLYRPGEGGLVRKGAVKFPGARPRPLPELDFGRAGTAFLEGRPFPLPENREEYLAASVPPGWEKGEAGIRRRFPFLMEPGLPAEEYLRRADAQGLRRPYARARGKALRPGPGKEDWAYVRRCWRLLCRSITRLRLREEYLPRLEELRELRRREDWEALEEALGPFLDAMEEYGKWGLGLAFDGEVFRLAWEALERRGRSGRLERLLGRIPPAFFRPPGKEDEP